MHIAFCVDRIYARYMGIAMTSIVMNHIGLKIHFHIIYDEIDFLDIAKLRAFAALYGQVNLSFYKLGERSTAQFQNFPLAGILTKAAYYRFMIANLLDTTIEKALYLDADTLCLRNIRDFYQIQLEEKIPAACSDLEEQASCARIGLKNGRYFNSGVLLLNLKKWREENFTNSLLHYMKTHKDTRLGDQDALNKFLDGNFIRGEKRFNYLVVANYGDQHAMQAAILHYVNFIKPWHKYKKNDDRKQIYWKYVRQSLWADLEEEEPNSVPLALLTARVMKEEGILQEAVRYYEAVVRNITNRQ